MVLDCFTKVEDSDPLEDFGIITNQ
jgi:hypothetical protein